MPLWLQGHALWVVFLFMFAIGMARGQGTYWLARLTTQAPATLRRWGTPPHEQCRLPAWQIRMRSVLEGEAGLYGRRLVARWGLAAIPLCYLTVGLQTLVLAGAGVLGVRWLRFSCAQVAGALCWALIYTTIGWALWQAAFTTAASSPWAVAAVGCGLAVAVLTWTLRRSSPKLVGVRWLQRRLPSLIAGPPTINTTTTNHRWGTCPQQHHSHPEELAGHHKAP